MELRELKEYDYIPKDGYYSTMEWYIGVVPRLKKVLNVVYGKREVIVDSDFWESGELDVEGVVEYVRDCIEVLFIEKRDSYNRIWNVLKAEYNPIWNVESKETLSYRKRNEGNEGIEESNTGTVGVQGTNTGTVGVQGTNTGTVGVQGTNTGTVGVQGTNTGTVSSEGEGSGESVNSLTPFNSSSWMNSDKGETNTSDSSTRTDDLSHSETRTDNLSHGETRTDNLSHGETRTDNLSHGETRTDNLSHDMSKDSLYNEEYEETRERGGNIGVTKSSELVESEVTLRVSYNFVDIVSKDIVNMICYSC